MKYVIYQFKNPIICIYGNDGLILRVGAGLGLYGILFKFV